MAGIDRPGDPAWHPTPSTTSPGSKVCPTRSRRPWRAGRGRTSRRAARTSTCTYSRGGDGGGDAPGVDGAQGASPDRAHGSPRGRDLGTDGRGRDRYSDEERLAAT